MEIKDLPQLEEATESDHVVSSISQKTRLISYKNIFEKISFSSLVTTAKNIIGSINELKGRCDTLDTSVSELNTDIDFASHLKYIGTQTVTLSNQQTFSINTAQGIKKIIAMINDGISIAVCSATLTDESTGKFYIVLNTAYTGTINVFIVGFDFSM